MTNKTVKEAVEYYKGVWPEGAACIAVDLGMNFIPMLEGITITTIGECTYIHKQQFEDYVKEVKMEKQKFKYVDAGIKTVGDLVDALHEGGFRIFNGNVELDLTGYLNVVNKDYSSSYNIDELEQILPELTTRQPLPWYEVEGVFDVPKLVRCNVSGVVIIATSSDQSVIYTNMGSFRDCDITPLTPSEAVKYGVE